MAVWKVFVVVLFGTVSLGLALATIIVPMTLAVGTERWLWLGGLLFGTLVVGALFVFCLRSMDRTYNQRQ